MAQKAVGLPDPTVQKQLADIGGADRNAVQRDLGDHVAAKPVFRAVSRELLRRPLAVPAEAEVMPDHKVDGAELRPQSLDKVRPGDAHRLLGELEEDDAVDAEALPDELRPGRGAVDERHGLTPQQGIRVVVEVMTAGTAPMAAARKTVRRSSAAWPRCTPSKKPSASTLRMSAPNVMFYSSISKKLFIVSATPSFTSIRARNSPGRRTGAGVRRRRPLRSGCPCGSAAPAPRRPKAPDTARTDCPPAAAAPRRLRPPPRS